MPNTRETEASFARDVVCALGASSPVEQALAGRPWETRRCAGLSEFFGMAAEQRLDAVVVDVQSIGIPARKLVQRIRANARTRALPIIFITDGQGEATAEILGSGADDCLIKPVDPELLCARVEAALRTIRQFSRPDSWARHVLRSRDGRVVLNLKAYRFQVQIGLEYEERKLTRKQMDVLALLMRRGNQVVGWRDFFSRGWKPARLQKESRTLVQHVMRLRQLLGPLADRIETVAGVGYRWVD